MENQPDSAVQPDESAGASPALAKAASTAPSSLKYVLTALTLVAVVTLQAAGTWSAYHAEIRNDQYQLLQVGQCVNSGGTLYVDCWENKPPGIAWINALGVRLSSDGQFAAWLLPGLFGVLGIGVLMYAVARTFSLASACLTALVAAVVFSLRIYDADSISLDFYSAVFEMSACSLWVLAIGQTHGARRLLTGIAAGLLWAAAVSVKQTGVTGLLVVTAVAIVLFFGARTRDRRWLAATAFAWTGFALGIGAVAAVLARAQTLGIALDAVFSFNAGLLGWEQLAGLFHSWPRLREWMEPVELPLWLALVGLVGTLRTGRANRLSSSFAAAMLIWWVVQAGLALLGPSRSIRYWQATFPAMLWLVAAGIYHLQDIYFRVEKRRRIVPAIVCATCVVLLGRPLLDRYAHGLASSYVAFSKQETERDRLTAMGEEIRALVPEGDRIYVWNYDAGIYVHSRRFGASRHNHPRSVEHMREILDALGSGRAALLLISNAGAWHFDRWCDEACREELDEILHELDRKGAIGGYQAWMRRSNVSPAPSP